MECLSCGQGMVLSNGRCTSCPANCLDCSGSACIECALGFTLSNNVCVKKCQLPCVSCAANLPSVCTSCQEGSTLFGSTCVLSMTCNTDNSCTYCGQGHNYFLVRTSNTGGYCSQCPTISNCIQCSEVDASMCIVCKNGYYVEANGTCTQCHANCTECISNITCTACADGWTFSQLVNEGLCLAC